MRKTIIIILMLLPLWITQQMYAVNDIRVKSIDLTIDDLRAGMTVQEAEDLVLKSAKTAYGDLVDKGVVSIMEISWSGDMDDSNPEEPVFKAGFGYTAHIRLAFDLKGGYISNYRMLSGEHVVDDSSMKATVNGVPARVTMSAPYYPSIVATLTVPGNGATIKGEAKKDYAEKVKADRAITRKSISKQKADLLWTDNPDNEITWTINRENKPEKGYPGLLDLAMKLFPDYSYYSVKKMIFDVSQSDMKHGHTYLDFAFMLDKCLAGLKEIWIGENVVDPEFVTSIGYVDENEEAITTHGPVTEDFCVMIPQSLVPAVRKAYMESATKGVHFHTIRVYNGDVYTAQAAGIKATKVLCNKHEYTMVLKTQDRLLSNASCTKEIRYYYSCKNCGKCERNPKHVSGAGLSKNVCNAAHYDISEQATEEAYLGKNIAGEYVFETSCQYCGHSRAWQIQHPTAEEMRNMGGPEIRKQYAVNNDIRKQEALAQAEVPVGFFVLPAKSTGKASPWAQNSANLAACDNIIDDQLLGNDYTRGLTRQQMASIVVRFAENMTGKDVKDGGQKFADASNPYADKVASMGLMDGIVNGNFAPNTVVSRQELATVVYRTLRYIEKNSKYSYSEYTPNLSKYIDRAQLKAWAKEPMEFMLALGVMKPATATTLTPNAPASIELALDAVERGSRAHKAGWYQCIMVEKDGDLEIPRYNFSPIKSTWTRTDIIPGERIWCTLPPSRIGEWLTAKDPYTGEIRYLESKYFRPIRLNGEDEPDDDAKATVEKKAKGEKQNVKGTQPKEKKRKKFNIGKAIKDNVGLFF